MHKLCTLICKPAGTLEASLRFLTALAGMLALSVAAQAAESQATLAPSGQFSVPDSAIAQIPIMGWDPWNAFRTEVNEDKIMGVAQSLVKSGLSDLGYVYVGIDDGWWLKRRKDGRLEIRTSIFPSAAVKEGDTTFKPLVDRLHGMGLKAGLYTDIGRNTCSQYWDPKSPNLPEGTVKEREVGSMDHQAEDMRLIFGEWKFDLIKVDACGLVSYSADKAKVRSGLYRELPPLIDMKNAGNTDVPKVRALYSGLRDALQSVRPQGDYVLSVCLWGQADVADWGRNVGAQWRTSSDISAKWTSMLRNFDSAAARPLYAGPGHFNDPDMLEIGNGEFDARHLVEARAHLSLWAMVSAPLLLGSDLTQWPQSLFELVSNREVIALDQDMAGNQGITLSKTADSQVLVKTLADGAKAVALINRGSKPVTASVPVDRLQLDAQQKITVRNLWTHEDRVLDSATISADLAPHETRLLKVSGTRVWPDALYLSEIPARINVAVDGRMPATPQAWIAAQANTLPSGSPIVLNGTRFDDGIGVLPNSRLEVKLNREFKRFSVTAGAAGKADLTIGYRIYGDGKLLKEARAPGITRFDVAVEGVQILELVAEGKVPASTELAWAAARLDR